MKLTINLRLTNVNIRFIILTLILGMKVLVLCTGNACRSQMAHGFLEHYSKGNFETYSAGVEIHGVNPWSVKMLAEKGLDISHYTSNHVDEYSNIDFDYVITVCDNAKESCPIFPNTATMIHHSFEDPGKAVGSDGEVTSVFRKVRDEIDAFCKEFVEKINE